METRDKINIFLGAASTLAAIAMVGVTIALLSVNSQLAGLQKKEILNRAKAQIDVVGAKEFFTPEVPNQPGVRRAILLVSLKNTSSWDAKNITIEWRHSLGDKKWQPKVPEGKPHKIKMIKIEKTGMMFAFLGKVDPSLKEKYEVITALKPGEFFDLAIGAHTVADPKDTILKKDKHLPFGIRFTWTGPIEKPGVKVKYIDIRRESSPASAGAAPYIYSEPLDDPPEDMPKAFKYSL